MAKEIIIRILITVLFLMGINEVHAQLNIKRDDFIGTGSTARRNWWRWHDEGTAGFPNPEAGYLRLTLEDANAALGMNNCGFWDGFQIYGDVKCKVRAKALTPAFPGSRGWGFWYNEPYSTDPILNFAWFLEQDEIPSGDPNDIYWRAQIANGLDWNTFHYIDLDGIANISEWHLYEVTRTFNPDLVTLSIDGEEVLSDDQDIPYRLFAFNAWIDNQVYHIPEGSYDWAIYQRSFTGISETIIDYVEVVTIDSTSLGFIPNGNVHLRKIPNEMGDGRSQFLWKTYNFNTGETINGVFLLTARAEDYGTYSDDDDIRINIDGQDYGWDTEFSINGDILQDASKTLRIDKSLDVGNHVVSIYGDITPLLYDATIIGSNNGGIIFDQEFNEIGPGGTDYEWKTIDFLTRGGEINIYISGTADEDPNPTHYGTDYSRYNDGFDDDLRLVLDENNYGYQTDQSLYGNRLFGEPKSILITETLDQGSHRLRIYANNSPSLYRVTIYGENDDVPLPITLSTFEVEVKNDYNLIKWITESEINNSGFNIYKASSSINESVENLKFSRLNIQLIPGSGTSSNSHVYSFIDKSVQAGWYYWYQLEDVDINGLKKKHEIKKVHRPGKTINSFFLYQNYPNPFNETTQIKFELTNETSVKLNIYSIDGKLIYYYVFGRLNLGSYVVEWDGRDKEGNSSPSGIYYFQLVVENNSIYKPMVLIK